MCGELSGMHAVTKKTKVGALEQNLFLVPFLTGTTIEGARFPHLTQFKTVHVGLYPLSFQTMWTIVNETGNESGKLDDLMQSIELRNLIADIGGIYICLVFG